MRNFLVDADIIQLHSGRYCNLGSVPDKLDDKTVNLR